jgi:hypothetical protein
MIGSNYLTTTNGHSTINITHEQLRETIALMQAVGETQEFTGTANYWDDEVKILQSAKPIGEK